MVRFVTLLLVIGALCSSHAQTDDLPPKLGYQIDSSPEKMTIQYLADDGKTYAIGQCLVDEGKVDSVVSTSVEVLVDLPKKPRGEYMMLQLVGAHIVSNGETIDLQEAKDRVIRYSQALRLTRSRGLVVFEIKDEAPMLHVLELILTTSRTERLAIRLGDDPTKFAELQRPE